VELKGKTAPSLKKTRWLKRKRGKKKRRKALVAGAKGKGLDAQKACVARKVGTHRHRGGEEVKKKPTRKRIWTQTTKATRQGALKPENHETKAEKGQGREVHNKV